MSVLDASPVRTSTAPERMTIVVPAAQVARGQPAVVTVSVACGSLADLPDDEWFAEFRRTEGSLADLQIERPDQPRCQVI